MALTDGLVGHWPLMSNGCDVSEWQRVTSVRRLDFDAVGPGGAPATAARFAGDGCLEVMADAGLDTGTGDFSVAAWVRPEPDGDIVGDVVSRYDPQARRGFGLSVVSHPGVTTSMANDRNVHFGVDDDVIDAAWTDCGRPGAAVFVYALAVFDGALYAATCEPGADQAGHVYRYERDGEWIDCGSPAPCNAVSSLVAHEGELYCGVSRYKLAGSCLPDSPNRRPGGAVFRYAGGSEWVNCGQLDDGNGIHCMCTFQGRLYATPTYQHQVFEYQGGSCWEPIGPDARVMSMGFWDGHLYALTSGADSVYRYDGHKSWTDCGRPDGTSQLYSFVVYQGRPHLGTWPRGEVFRYDGGQTWTSCGSPGYSREVMGMALHNGTIFAGTLPMADVYRYGGDGRWAYTGGLDASHGYQLRRAWSMAVYQGRLFCGTLPSGHVYGLRAGAMATWDRRLPEGWHHLAGVRCRDQLQLWVDGALVSTAPIRDSAAYDMSTGQPLRIGAGQHAGLRGWLSDVRLYARALSQPEVGALAATRRTGTAGQGI